MSVVDPDRVTETVRDGSRKRAQAPSAMVTTAFPAATAAGLRMLRAGGNAVDAAVAAAWALAVCEPSGSGLGGQATILLRFPDGRTTVLDGHSHAPAAVSRRTVDRVAQRLGRRSSTVPSMPAALGAALARFGTLPLERVLEPAIALAADGFAVTRLLRRHIRLCREQLAECPLSARIFLPDGRPAPRGHLLRQPELADTLRRLARHGVEDFYRGALARDVAADMAVHGGLLTEEDLRSHALPVEREPLSVPYRGVRVVSVPPPGGGLQVLLALRVLERLLSSDASSAERYEATARVTLEVFRERERWQLRHDGIPASFLRWLVGEDRAAEIADVIRAGGDRTLRPTAEGPGDTTHLCAVDSDGLTVSLTQSVQSLFGAKVQNRTLGFFYNNYLCTCPRYRHPYRLKGGARPQSNAAPTLVLPGEGDARQEPLLVLGAAGSRRILSSIVQVITNVLDRGMPLLEAVDAPRVHAVSSGRVLLERRAATDDLVGRLGQSFSRVEIKAPRSYAMGGVQAIAADGEGGWVGVADPRREGEADGD